MPHVLFATLAVAAAASLTACVAPTARLDMPFDDQHAAALLRPGTATIKGSALLRQVGGGVVTCAGSEVFLIPATDYAKRRMSMIYGSKSLSRGLNFENTPPGYIEQSRKTMCNAQGFFAFENVADGEFFVQTTVVWQAGYSVQGGALAQRVKVAGGRANEVVITEGCFGCD